MKNKISKLLLLSLFFMNDLTAFAQGGPGDEGDGGLEGGDPAPAPINSKLLVLGIVGFIYAAYKMKNYKKALS